MIREFVTRDANVVPFDWGTREARSGRRVQHARPRGSGVGARWAARVGASAAAIALMLASSALPGYGFPETLVPPPAEMVHFNNPTAETSWNAILKWSGIEAAFPMLPFGNRFVSLQQVCVDGDELRIADPRLDNGVRVAADGLRAQARASLGEHGPAPAAALAAAAGGPVSLGGIRYRVSVYRVLYRTQTNYVFLFEKPWDVPACTR
jgi:hypothetical protein